MKGPNKLSSIQNWTHIHDLSKNGLVYFLYCDCLLLLYVVESPQEKDPVKSFNDLYSQLSQLDIEAIAHQPKVI